MVIYSKKIVTLDGIVEGYLEISEGTIIAIHDQYAGEFVDHSEKIIMPGYIDIHTHGWGTGSYWFEKTPESIWEMQKHLPKTGVTSFLASTGTDSIPNTFTYIEAGNIAYKNQKQGAELLGLHMEGPFISKEYKGLQKEEHCLDPDMTLMQKFYDAQVEKSMVKMMTLAPELPNAKALIQFNTDHNITTSIGHSGADFETIKSLKEYGLKGVTHMFSGMRGFHHRELGVAGAALYFDDLMCEFAKQSGRTVKHEAFDIVYRLKGDDGIYLTTDCQGLAKSIEPFYHYIRGEKFEPEDGKLKITNDSGEVIYLNPNDYEDVKDLEVSFEKSVMNLMKHTDMSLVSLSKITSLNPAKYIGVNNRKGSISIGKDADIIILNDELKVFEAYCKGIESTNI